MKDNQTITHPHIDSESGRVTFRVDPHPVKTCIEARIDVVKGGLDVTRNKVAIAVENLRLAKEEHNVLQAELTSLLHGLKAVNNWNGAP